MIVDIGYVCYFAGFFGIGVFVNVLGVLIFVKFWVMLFELDSVSLEYFGE